MEKITRSLVFWPNILWFFGPIKYLIQYPSRAVWNEYAQITWSFVSHKLYQVQTSQGTNIKTARTSVKSKNSQIWRNYQNNWIKNSILFQETLTVLAFVQRASVFKYKHFQCDYKDAVEEFIKNFPHLKTNLKYKTKRTLVQWWFLSTHK